MKRLLFVLLIVILGVSQVFAIGNRQPLEENVYPTCYPDSEPVTLFLYSAGVPLGMMTVASHLQNYEFTVVEVETPNLTSSMVTAILLMTHENGHITVLYMIRMRETEQFMLIGYDRILRETSTGMTITSTPCGHWTVSYNDMTDLLDHALNEAGVGGGLENRS